MSYKIEELDIRNDSLEEQVRTREIFEDLRAKALSKDSTMTEHEKEFFCSSLRLSSLDDGSPEEFECCENHRFKFLFLLYYHDLTGGSRYYKPVPAIMSVEEIPLAERLQDLDFLYNQAAKWESVVLKENHSEQLLQRICKETREELKALEKSSEFVGDPHFRGRRRYTHKRNGTLLRSKYIYLYCKFVQEREGKLDFELQLGGQLIHFDEHGLTHVMLRHYSETTTQFQTGKSYHSEDFLPEHIHHNLQLVFDIISPLIPSSGFDYKKICFTYNNQMYIIWTEERTKGVKGQGMIRFRRIDSFYPVTDETELAKIASAYEEHQSASYGTSLFVKR